MKRIKPNKKETECALKILTESIEENTPDIVIRDSWSQREGTTGVIKLQYDPTPQYEENAHEIVEWFSRNVSGKLFHEIIKEILDRTLE